MALVAPSLLRKHQGNRGGRTNIEAEKVGVCDLVHTLALVVKNLPASVGRFNRQFQFLGREEPLEKEMATHSTILAWRVP